MFKKKKKDSISKIKDNTGRPKITLKSAVIRNDFLIFTVTLRLLLKRILSPKSSSGRKLMGLLLEHLRQFQRRQKKISRTLKSMPKKPPHTGNKTRDKRKSLTYHNYTALAFCAEL